MSSLRSVLLDVDIERLSSPLLETGEKELPEFVVLLLLVLTVLFVFSILVFAVTSKLDQSDRQNSVILPLWPSYKHSPYWHPSSLRPSPTSSPPWYPPLPLPHRLLASSPPLHPSSHSSHSSLILPSSPSLHHRDEVADLLLLSHQ